MKRYAIVLMLCAISTMSVVAQEAVDPYAVTPNDPFSLSATVMPNAGGSFTVLLTVKDKATGAVVFSPKVTTQPNIPAEVFSDSPDSENQFEAVVRVNRAGKANVTFKAFRRVLQRSKIEATTK